MYYVTTTDRSRLAHWDRILGADRLPVRSDRPRLQETRHGSRLAYDLDVARLRSGQVYRLAATLARATGRTYAQVLDDLRVYGWPVDADGLVVYCEETAVAQRPFLAYVFDALRRRLQPAA